jgi:hypothetical protein
MNHPADLVPEALIGQHSDVIERHHRFGEVTYLGTPWDLSHLDPFAMRLDPGLGYEIDVVVLFTCHCFSHSIGRDGRAEIPAHEIFDNGQERRVLDEERYQLSRQYLPGMIRDLPGRTIQIAGSYTANFMTLEVIEAGEKKHYAVFFEAKRDSRRKRRVLLYVQSAYLLDTLTDRKKKASKVRFHILLKAAYEGRKIKG